jgi:hypothetical protein
LPHHQHTRIQVEMLPSDTDGFTRADTQIRHEHKANVPRFRRRIDDPLSLIWRELPLFFLQVRGGHGSSVC